jgi:hypothetical protein
MLPPVPARDESARPIQLYLQLPYKFDPIRHARVRELLAQGYRIDQFQRITDRDAIVTLVPDSLSPGAGSGTPSSPR